MKAKKRWECRDCGDTLDRHNISTLSQLGGPLMCQECANRIEVLLGDDPADNPEKDWKRKSGIRLA